MKSQITIEAAENGLIVRTEVGMASAETHVFTDYLSMCRYVASHINIHFKPTGSPYSEAEQEARTFVADAIAGQG